MARPAPIYDPGIVSAGFRFFSGPFDPFNAAALAAFAAPTPLTLEHWTQADCQEYWGMQDVDLPDDKVETVEMTTQQSRGPWGSLPAANANPAFINNVPYAASKTQVPGFRGINPLTLKFIYGTNLKEALTSLKPVDANLELVPAAPAGNAPSGLAPRGRRTVAIWTPDAVLFQFKGTAKEVSPKGPVSQPVALDFIIDQEGPIMMTYDYIPSF